LEIKKIDRHPKSLSHIEIETREVRMNIIFMAIDI